MPSPMRAMSLWAASLSEVGWGRGDLSQWWLYASPVYGAGGYGDQGAGLEIGVSLSGPGCLGGPFLDVS